MMTLPNILTVSRICMLPIIIGLFYMEASWGALAAWACLLVYIVAAITDFLDGYFARKLKQISEFGKFFDPVSDKIVVAAVLILLVGFDRLSGLWVLPVVIILLREFMVSGLREYLGPQNIRLPVTQLAKWKTATQMLSLGFLIIGPYVPYALATGQILLTLAALLTIVTGWGYLKTGLAHMKKMA